MEPEPSPPATRSALHATAERVRRELDQSLASRDRDGALGSSLAAVDSGALSIPDLYTLVLAPLMADTGSAWQRGATRVWEEHYATATVRTIIEALAPRVAEARARVPSRRETVLLACPPGEHHDLGLRMMLDRFVLAGYDAHFLGADTPVAEICHAAEELGASLVVLSASTHYNRVKLREVVERLRAGLAEEVRITAGGPAFAGDTCACSELLVDPATLDLPGAAPTEDG